MAGVAMQQAEWLQSGQPRAARIALTDCQLMIDTPFRDMACKDGPQSFRNHSFPYIICLYIKHALPQHLASTMRHPGT